MDAILDILQMCPFPIAHSNLSTNYEQGLATLTVEIEDTHIDTDDVNGMTPEQAAQLECMCKQLINMACTVLSTDARFNRICMELAYTTYNDLMDIIGTIIIVERSDEHLIRIERYDPKIMDTVTTFRSIYENDIMGQLEAIRI